MKRTKSTRAAWKEIRKAYQAYAEFGDCSDIALDGLCHAVTAVQNISAKQLEQMRADLANRKPRLAKDLSNISYYWPMTRAGARNRVKLIDKILKESKRPKIL